MAEKVDPERLVFVVTRPPGSGPVTMRVHEPAMGGRRTLEVGQRTLTGAQNIRKLRQAEGKLASGSTVPEVDRELDMSEATYHRGRNRHGGMGC